MAAGNRDRRDQLMPQLVRQLLELGVVERAQIRGFVDPIEQWRGTIGTHSLYPADVWEGLRRIDPLSMTFIGPLPPLQLSYRRGRLVSPAPAPSAALSIDTGSVLGLHGFGAGGPAVLVERDFLDPRLGSAQQRVAMGLERLAPLVDEDRGLKLDVALFQAIDDGFELLQRLLEVHGLDVGVVFRFGHGPR